ncbi:Uncharacterised protein [Mycobacteroides abscessus subsp. abscessus]|nr:Uncharacterised protein [Mycobacteroides abscessus subsp. abscessus]
MATTTSSAPAARKNSIRRLAGSDSLNPKNARKSDRPVKPPSACCPVSRIASAAASAWLRIAKYAPLTRRLNTP